MAETDYAVPRESRRTGRVVARVRRALLPHLIFYSGLLIGLLLLLLCAIVLYEGRIDARDRARTTQQNIALMASWDIERNIEIYSLSLQAVVDGANDPAVANLPMPLRRQVLFDRATTAKYLGGIYVLDANGDIAVDGKTDIPRKFNFANEAYFAVHRDHPDVGLYVSDPYHSRLRDGSLSIALSRRITRPDGSFGGVAVMSIRLEYFQNLFARLALGDRGSVALIKTNGRMVARQPYDPSIVGRDISHASTFRHFMTASEGSFTDTATIDGVRRLYVFRHLENLPLILMVARSEADTYAAWYDRAIPIGSAMVALAIGFIGLSLLLDVQLRKRQRAEAELQALARTDGLTGLDNRRMLDVTLAREWRRAARSQHALSLLFVDVDHFKRYNDTQGHQAGDDALAAVGRCIAGCLRRPADYAARYGGEEFVVVLPDVDTDGAVAIAETIRTGILDLGIRHDAGMCGRVTASIGVTTCYPERGDTIQAALKLADDALYRAKASGRNQVVVHTAADGERAPRRA
ncbi:MULTISPECIES: sensor domain-containing diguanylate cyclase [Burkholderia]|uniref:sensor domain-containing diguanylate cyclase n=1 Tax=Burkholderia TaxID=32008 RepID=UPI000755DE4A|nr:MULTISPECIES: GGDEF domain-containing protein [Burkholderia]AOK13315.1 diguanylate cyclase [Burkholderia vietnamiensis]KVF78953.1 diguanylate cyclase [Burkholderia vietnamiensis]KVF86266.1 diguanylate cyclase [Burkholderia vietnamiensis]KVF87504.1 diguanylate cyclase [Burkholderia vietnamiensis]KVG05115.1 diguanylate cyclase [Burkholderia vietnamiensis]